MNLCSFPFFKTIGLKPSPSQQTAQDRNPPPPPTLSFGWLVPFSTEWQLPKAWAPPLALFFDAFHFTPPKQVDQQLHARTQKLACEMDSWGLAVPWFGALPQRYRAKPLGAHRVVAAHLVVVCCVCDWLFSHGHTNLQMPSFPSNENKS